MHYIPTTNTILSSHILFACVAAAFVFVACATCGLGIINYFLLKKSLAKFERSMERFLKNKVFYTAMLPSMCTLSSGLFIWLWASLVWPQTVSSLAHLFTWIFGIQCLAFMVQTAAAFVMFSRSRLLSPMQNRLIFGTYAASASFIVVSIAAVVSFSLTPGKWPVTFDFWDALFNPSFIPSAVLGFAWSLILAVSLFLEIIAASSEFESTEIGGIQRNVSKWLSGAAVVFVIAPLWFMSIGPSIGPAFQTVGGKSMCFFAAASIAAAVSVAHIFSVIFIRRTRYELIESITVVFLLVVSTCMAIVAHSSLRGPYNIRGYVYSNDLTVADCDRFAHQGLLASMPEISPAAVDLPLVPPKLKGEWIYKALRYDEYLGADASAFKRRFAGVDACKTSWLIEHINAVYEDVPPFCGLDSELESLSQYLSNGEPKRCNN